MSKTTQQPPDQHTPDGIPAPIRDLLTAVLEAIDLPYPATASGAETHDRLLATRVTHACTTLRTVLDDGPDLGPAWNAKYLRERLAEHPVTGYVTAAQAQAAIADGKTWSEAVTLPTGEAGAQPGQDVTA